MKKILLSTIVLLAFTLSVVLFQVSCKKEANAQTSSYTLPPATTSKLGGVIPDGTTISVDGNGKISTSGNVVQQQNKILYVVYGSQPNTDEIWSANYDGTNAQKINIVLPTGLAIGDTNFTISPDRKMIFFSVFSPTGGTGSIYACNIDGSNPHKIISNGPAGADVVVAY